MDHLTDLLHHCTVKITIPGRSGWGTGFFVAPGLILTCAHVVKQAAGQAVQVLWQSQTLEAVVARSLTDPDDLALLRVTLAADVNPPCVLLDEAVQSRDPLYLFGYPDEGDRQGEPRTFNCDGITGGDIPAILFNLGQVRPGMSGSPLLNQRTGKVCGMVKFTRDRTSDLGGGAIPTSVILEQLPQLRELQQQFHQQNPQWLNLVAAMTPKLSHVVNGDTVAGDKIGGDKIGGDKIGGDKVAGSKQVVSGGQGIQVNNPQGPVIQTGDHATIYIQSPQPSKSVDIDVQPYLQSLITTYAKWWQYYTLTDAEGRQRQMFDFEWRCCMIEKGDRSRLEGV